MAYKPELVAITPELKKRLDELKHKLNFSTMAEYRAKRVLAYGDIIKIMYDYFIANGQDKKILEVPNDQQGTDPASSN